MFDATKSGNSKKSGLSGWQKKGNFKCDFGTWGNQIYQIYLTFWGSNTGCSDFYKFFFRCVEEEKVRSWDQKRQTITWLFVGLTHSTVTPSAWNVNIQQHRFDPTTWPIQPPIKPNKQQPKTNSDKLQLKVWRRQRRSADGELDDSTEEQTRLCNRRRYNNDDARAEISQLQFLKNSRVTAH